jgi:hypothetical protein
MKSIQTKKRPDPQGSTFPKSIHLKKVWPETFISILFFTFQGCSNSSTSFHEKSVQKKLAAEPTTAPSITATTNEDDSQSADATAQSAIGDNAAASTPPSNTTTSAVTEQIPVPVFSPKDPFQPCVANGVSSPTQPINAKVYQLRTGAASIAEKVWDQSMYKTSICMTSFNAAPRLFTDGFPGIPNLSEWFGIDARAKIVVPVSGTYKFRLYSDDGSILTINNQVVIDHDGQHRPSSKDGSIQLTQGMHDLKVLYFQGPAAEIALQLFWTPPGSPEEIVPTTAFRTSGF